MSVHIPGVPLALDPLIAEAKRRARQRRSVLAVTALLVVALATWLTLAQAAGQVAVDTATNRWCAPSRPKEFRCILTEWDWGRTVGRSAVESEWSYRSLDHQFSVIVFHPARIGLRFGGAAPTTTAWARNVVAYWTTGTLVPAGETRIRAALSHLAASPPR